MLPVIAAALVAVILWGSSSVATKVALVAFPSLAVAVLRTALGGLAALPLLLALRLPLPNDGGRWRLLAVSSSCGFLAFPALFSAGMQSTSAVHGAMLLALLPIATGAIALAWERRWPHRFWWLGCAVAVAGEAVLILSRQGPGDSRGGLFGDALVLLSVLFGAAGNVAGGRLQQAGYPAKATTLWSVTLATAVLVPALPWLLSGVAWGQATAWAWGGVIYLAVGVTILGYGLWYWALGKGGIARIGLLQFLQPVSGVLLAWLLLGEPVSASLPAATALILLGVWIATRTSLRFRFPRPFGKGKLHSQP